jgi:hypothetical protein
MRYYSYNEYDPDHPDEGYVVTLSEDDIRKEYYPYWYKKMCDKYEQAYVDEHYSFEDCLEDWTIVHWAWESK